MITRGLAILTATASLIAMTVARADQFDAQIDAMKAGVANSIQQNQDAVRQQVVMAMQSPECWNAYVQMGARANGEPYDQFAYEWIVSGRFSQPGLENLQQSNADLMRRQLEGGQLLQNDPNQ